MLCRDTWGEPLVRKLPALMFLMAGLGILGGCSSAPGSGSGPTNAFGNFLAFGTTAPPPPPDRSKEVVKLDCPEVEVLGGAAAMRVGGQENASVRYQYSMGDVARECQVENGQINIKVGVEGRVLLGPAGGPGSFQVPVRIAIRREADQKPAMSKVYRIDAAIAPGESQTTFNMVSDTFQVPYLRPRADDDYTIVVGFDDKAEAPAARRQKRRR
jgi:hypothetical protein